MFTGGANRLYHLEVDTLKFILLQGHNPHTLQLATTPCFGCKHCFPQCDGKKKHLSLSVSLSRDLTGIDDTRFNIPNWVKLKGDKYWSALAAWTDIRETQ